MVKVIELVKVVVVVVVLVLDWGLLNRNCKWWEMVIYIICISLFLGFSNCRYFVSSFFFLGNDINCKNIRLFLGFSFINCLLIWFFKLVEFFRGLVNCSDDVSFLSKIWWCLWSWVFLLGCCWMVRSLFMLFILRRR